MNMMKHNIRDLGPDGLSRPWMCGACMIEWFNECWFVNNIEIRTFI